ncbi:hypothetical protein E4T56_gene12867 [Termitomyces sp. T112]|nr:hypothetical protein E4T56_gene12867 [Termitomyces sp. T112]
MSFDNVQIADNLSCLNSPRQLLPYPISRHEAELHWEKTRQEVRDRIAALPNSSFQKTMLEEDERFYATFPQARQAAINAWIAQEFPYAPWAQPSSSTYEGIDCGGLPKVYTPSVHAHPVPDFSTFTLANALALSPSQASGPEVPAQLPLTIVYDASTKAIERNSNTSSIDHISSNRARSSQGCDSNKQGPVSEIVSKPCDMPTPCDQERVFLALQVVAPARRTRPARSTRKVNPRPPPYTPLKPEKRENAYPSTFFATPPESTRTSSPNSPPFDQLQYTGDWEADAIATAEYLQKSERTLIHGAEKPTFSVLPPHSKESYADVSPTCARRFSSRKNHPSSHPRHRSNMPSKLLASGQQLTFPVPRKRAKLLRDKDGKPVMACLFCRGRKIACGPPPAGSDDPTCNQCARRGLACHYPAESRRGQRKRKTAFINAQSNDVTTLLKLYRKATLKDDDLHLMSDESDFEWDGRDLKS